MKKLFLFSVCLMLPFAAIAADAPKEKADEKPILKPAVKAPMNAPNPDKIPALKKLKEQGKDLSFDYLGRRFGMDAWVISGTGVMQIIYTDPKGIAAIVGGMLIGPDGQEVSSAMQREFTENNPERAQKMVESARSVISDTKQGGAVAAAPKAVPSKADEIWARLGTLGLITVVSKDVTSVVPIVYAVLDPDQPQSKTAWEKLVALADDGVIILHVVPLATATASHLIDIAQILGSENNRRELWEKLLAGTADKPPETVDPKGAIAMNENVNFATEIKLYTVPFLFYRVPKGEGWDKVQAVKGLPKDWSKILHDLGAVKTP